MTQPQREKVLAYIALAVVAGVVVLCCWGGWPVVKPAEQQPRIVTPTEYPSPTPYPSGWLPDLTDCQDGSSSTSTGSGTCSGHGGIQR